MLKKLQICFLGYLCPFPNRSISKWWRDFFCINSTRSHYLTAIGGLFHRRSRSISQAEGLHISCINNHICGVTIRFVLVLFFGIVIKVSSQVACSPPGIELVDNPGIPALAGFHRSGETRSDTFYSVTAQDIDGGPIAFGQNNATSSSNEPNNFLFRHCEDRSSTVGENLSVAISSEGALFPRMRLLRSVPPLAVTSQAADCGLKTVDCNTPGFSLVDTSIPAGQGSDSSSAQVGALIYGELINPDSLEPLTFTFTANYLSRSSDYSQVSSKAELKEGTFFDGVLDPRVRKFLLEVPDFNRPQYLTLKIGEHTVMDNYLLFPADSIKLEINLAAQQLNFAGPASNGFELQYQMKRLRAQLQFDQSRKIVLADPNALLDQEDYREQWESQKRIFGARLEFEQFDQEGLESLLSQIENGEQELSAYDFFLAHKKHTLSAEKIDAYKLEVLGQYYQPLLSRLYRFYFPELHRIYAGDKLYEAHQKIKSLLESIPVNDFSVLSRLVASNWLDMELDRITLLALIENQSFLEVMNEHHAGELADRLAAGFLTQNLSSYTEPESMLTQYLAQMDSGPWKDKVLAMKAAVVPGDPMLDMELESLQRDTLSITALTGKPSLIYFYFSTCPHSAHYFQEMLFPLYQKKAKSMGVDLIAISVDRDPDLWRKQLSEFSDPSIPNYRMLQDSKEVFKDYYEISGYPRTFLIDGNGVILSFGLSRDNYAAFESDFLQEVEKMNSSSSLSTAKLKNTP